MRLCSSKLSALYGPMPHPVFAISLACVVGEDDVVADVVAGVVVLVVVDVTVLVALAGL